MKTRTAPPAKTLLKAPHAPQSPVPSENDPNLMYRRFVTWTALHDIVPDAPKSHDEFMFRHGLTKEDLSGFMSRPAFATDVSMKAASYYRTKLPTLLKATYETIKTGGSLADLERFVNVLNTIEFPKQPTGPGGTINNFFVNLKDEQYRRIVEREARVLNPRSEA